MHNGPVSLGFISSGRKFGNSFKLLYYRIKQTRHTVLRLHHVGTCGEDSKVKRGGLRSVALRDGSRLLSKDCSSRSLELVCTGFLGPSFTTFTPGVLFGQ